MIDSKILEMQAGQRIRRTLDCQKRQKHQADFWGFLLIRLDTKNHGGPQYV